MKQFLIFTAIIEGATGIGFILFPSIVVGVLLKLTLTLPGEIIVCHIAGVAIFSISLISWLSALGVGHVNMIKVLLFYNLAIPCILIYGIAKFELSAVALWVVIIFHLIQSIISVVLLSKNKTHKQRQGHILQR